jgi:hypothetical protein
MYLNPMDRPVVDTSYNKDQWDNRQDHVFLPGVMKGGENPPCSGVEPRNPREIT